MAPRAIVFGCTGQDGSLLTRSLINKGYQVIGVSRSSNPNQSIHKKLGIDGQFEITTADINDFRQILELMETNQPAEIYNLAAQSSVGLSFTQPVDTFDSIIGGTINLLEVVRYLEYPGRIYFAGSSEIFGNTSHPANLSSKRYPRSPYAIAKDASLNMVELYRNAYDVNCITGVLFNHESPYRSATFVTSKIVKGALLCVKDKSHKLRLGDLSVVRDWGWAEEYVEAMQLLIRAQELEDHVICTGTSTTLLSFVQTVFQKLDLDWQDHVIQDPTLRRPSEICASVGDPEPMYQAHGWRARMHIDQVIEQLIEAKQNDND